MHDSIQPENEMLLIILKEQHFFKLPERDAFAAPQFRSQQDDLQHLHHQKRHRPKKSLQLVSVIQTKIVNIPDSEKCRCEHSTSLQIVVPTRKFERNDAQADHCWTTRQIPDEEIFHLKLLTALKMKVIYLNHNSILQSTMRINQQNLGFAIMKIKFHNLLMDLLLTMNLFWQTFLQTTMDKR